MVLVVHGLGFAGAFQEIGVVPERAALSLLFFNIGVELGQICVIATYFGLLAIPFGKKNWYRQAVVYPLSCCIGLAALYWTVERL